MVKRCISLLFHDLEQFLSLQINQKSKARLLFKFVPCDSSLITSDSIIFRIDASYNIVHVQNIIFESIKFVCIRLVIESTGTCISFQPFNGHCDFISVSDGENIDYHSILCMSLSGNHLLFV